MVMTLFLIACCYFNIAFSVEHFSKGQLCVLVLDRYSTLGLTWISSFEKYYRYLIATDPRVMGEGFDGSF